MCLKILTRVNSPLTKEMERADSPDIAKLRRVQNTGKLYPQMDNKNMEYRSLVLLLSTDHR